MDMANGGMKVGRNKLRAAPANAVMKRRSVAELVPAYVFSHGGRSLEVRKCFCEVQFVAGFFLKFLESGEEF